MPSFADNETSRESSQPIELYEFTVGAIVRRYHSGEDTITVGGNDYLPETIRRSKIERSAEDQSRDLKVSVPTVNAIASLYVDVPPGERASVQVFRLQRNETPPFDTVVLLFTGRVHSVDFTREGTIAEFTVRTLEAAKGQKLPRYTYMSSCNHFLYDQFCKADPSAHNMVGTVTAQSGTTLTISGVSGSSHDFVGGYLTLVSSVNFRQVIGVSGDDVTLDIGFGEDLVGQNVQLFAGCDHLIDGDCALVFDQVAEFGGFPFVPNKNPFSTGLD